MLEELEYEHEKQKKVEDLEKQKKKNLKSLENQNKILLDQQEPTTIFWQTYFYMMKVESLSQLCG